MAISNLSNQHISASYQFLAQISASGDIYDGLGNQITQLNLVTSSYVTAQTASFVNPLRQDVRITGSIYVTSSTVTLGQFVGNQNGYVEFSVRNNSTGISASGDIAVYADTGTVSNNYIDMGIHNSGMNGSYSYFGTDFGNALDAYVYNVGGNLRIGNATSEAPFSQSFFLFSNPTATPNIWITGSQVAIGKSTGSINGSLDISGSVVISGSLIQAPTSLSPIPVTGSSEFDGSTFYLTSDSSGRALQENRHLFYLPTAITHSVTTIVDAFSGSLNAFTMQPNSLYEVQYNLFYQKGSANGITTFTLYSNTNTWQNANIQLDRTAVAFSNGTALDGNSTSAIAPVFSTVINSTNKQTVSLAGSSETSGSLQRAIIKGLFLTHTSGVNNLRLMVTSAGSAITVFPGSYYTITKMPNSSVGIFTA